MDSRVNRIGIMFLLAFFNLLAVPAQAEWIKLNSELNIVNTQSATAASIAIAPDGAPYVGWQENNGTVNEIFVKRWDGDSWILLGKRLNVNASGTATVPSLDINSSNKVFIAFAETIVMASEHYIYVKEWDKNYRQWNPVGAENGIQINTAKNAANPCLVINKDNTVAVTWQEENNSSIQTIYLKYWNWNGSGWSAPDPANGLNVKSNQDAWTPSLAVDNSADPPILYVAWAEGTLIQQIYVKWRKGTIWEPETPESLNINPANSANAPCIAVAPDGTPYVAWQEIVESGMVIKTAIYVKKWNGTTWESLPLSGESVSDPQATSFSPSIAVSGDNIPYIAWIEDNGTTDLIYVQRWNGNAWEPVGSALNDQEAGQPDIAVLNSGPYVTWDEQVSTECVYVKHWIPPTPTPTPELSLSATATPDLNVILETEQVIAYPLPAASRVSFACKSAEATGEVVIRIFNTHYRLVAELKGSAPAGETIITWDCSKIAPGVYFYQAVIGDKKLPVEKLVIAR